MSGLHGKYQTLLRLSCYFSRDPSRLASKSLLFLHIFLSASCFPRHTAWHQNKPIAQRHTAPLCCFALIKCEVCLSATRSIYTKFTPPSSSFFLFFLAETLWKHPSKNPKYTSHGYENHSCTILRLLVPPIPQFCLLSSLQLILSVEEKKKKLHHPKQNFRELVDTNWYSKLACPPSRQPRLY